MTSIGYRAFYGCSSLTSITIPDGVTSIGWGAFMDCSSLTSISIPDSVTSIGWDAFYGCSSLFVVTNKSDLDLIIGSSVNGYVAYYAYFVIDKDGNKTYRDGYISTDDGFVYQKDNGTYKLRAYVGGEDTVTLPSKLVLDGTKYDYKIYYMRGVRNVIIPDRVTSIGEGAFSGCSSLTSITIPDRVTSIGVSAFWYCSSLIDINYSGTKEQWSSIIKGSGWNATTGKYTVHCTDGDLTKAES